MARARRSSVLPWIGLVLVLRLAAGPGAPREEPASVAEAPAASALCETLGCGCPHEEARSECCCAPTAQPDAAPREASPTSVTSAELAATPPADAGLPRASLADFHCSGPKPGSSAASAPSSAALSWRPVAGPGFVRERGWSPRLEPGPPFDLATEPATPPPRRNARG